MTSVVMVLLAALVVLIVMRRVATPALMPGCAGGIYKNTGTFGTPTFVEQTLVRDVMPQSGWTFPEALSRETPIKLYAKATVDLPTQVVMRADPASAEFAAWIAWHWSRTAVFDLLILNGKITTEGATGYRGEFLASLTEAPQEIEGMIYCTFELRATRTTNGVPRYAVIAAGPSPEYTPITFA
jgi:hypothetical protein